MFVRFRVSRCGSIWDDGNAAGNGASRVLIFNNALLRARYRPGLLCKIPDERSRFLTEPSFPSVGSFRGFRDARVSTTFSRIQFYPGYAFLGNPLSERCKQTRRGDGSTSVFFFKTAPNDFAAMRSARISFRASRDASSVLLLFSFHPRDFVSRSGYASFD